MWPGIVHLDVYLKKNVLYVYVFREKCWLFLEFLSEIKPESFCLSVCISSVLNTEEWWVWSFCRATISPGQFSVEWLMRHQAYPPKWTGAIMLSPQSYGAGGGEENSNCLLFPAFWKLNNYILYTSDGEWQSPGLLLTAGHGICRH